MKFLKGLAGLFRGKKLIVTLSVLITVGCLSIAAIIYLNQPEVVAKRALKGAIRDLMKRDEIAPIVSMMEKGSFSFDANQELDGEAIGVGGKLYFGEDATMIENAYLRINNHRASFDAYFSDELSYLSNDNILNSTYGIVRGEMETALKNSILAHNSGSDYALDSKTYDRLLSSMKVYDDQGSKEAQALEKNMTKQLKKYGEKLIDYFEDAATYESDTKKVTVGNERIRARVITITLDADGILEILEALYDDLREDEEFEAVFDDYFDYIKDMLPDYFDTDHLYDDMLDALEEIIDILEDEVDEIDTEVVIELVTKRTSAKLLKLTVSAEEGRSSQEILSIDLGKDGIKKSERIEITFLEDEALVYEIKENNSKAYEATLSFMEYGDEYVIFDLEIDKKREHFELSFPEEKVSLSGDFISKKKTTTFRLNRIKSGGKTMTDFKIELVICEKEKMPKPLDAGAVKNIFALTEQDFERFFENASNVFPELID